MTKIVSSLDERISQCDILKDIEFIEKVSIEEGFIEIVKTVFPFVIVLTQDCDLQQNSTFNAEVKTDKGLVPHSSQNNKLLSILVAPLYNEDLFFQGKHLEEVGFVVDQIKKSKSEGDRIIKNQNPRFHYLKLPVDTIVPNSIIDFKHYFSISIEKGNEEFINYKVTRISELYREQISQRFSNYLSRIGLPNEPIENRE